MIKGSTRILVERPECVLFMQGIPTLVGSDLMGLTTHLRT